MAIWPWFLILPSLVLAVVDKGPSVRHCKTSTEEIDWDCRNRGLQGVPYDVFDARENIKLGNNPFTCDCSMVWFMRELDKAKEYIKDLDDMRCARPTRLANKKITNLKEASVCATELVSIKSCREYKSFNMLECGSSLTSNRIPFNVFETPMNDIDLDGSYICDCNMVWFVRKIKEQEFVKRINVDTITCFRPEKFIYQRVSRLTGQQLCPQKDANLCDTKPPPCNKKYSTCENTEGSYKCIDIDECLKNTHSCMESEHCVNHENGYTCKCNEGLVKKDSGIGCEVPPNPCTEKPGPCIDKYQICVQREAPGSYRCEDIDECLDETYKCSADEVCVNKDLGYLCKCKPGLVKAKTGIGCMVPKNPCTETPNPCNETTQICVRGKTFGTYKCEDILPCSTQLICASKAKCVYMKGKPQCVCKAGYHGNGKVCLDINECLSKRAKLCPDHSRCVNSDGSYKCVCKTGYSWNGEHCSDIDECTTNTHTCDKNALCTNTLGGYKCRCKEGFKNFKEGRLCVKLEKEKRSISSTNIIIISAGAIGFLIAILLATICFFKRKKTKQRSTEDEQALLLLEQQQNMQQQMFVFNDCFPADQYETPQINTAMSTVTTMTEWSEDEDDVEEEEDFDARKSTISKKRIRWG